MPTNDPRDYSRGPVVDSALLLASRLRQYVNGKATRADVEEAIRFWHEADPPAVR